MDGDSSSVLLLNSTFEPLTIINVRRALKLLFTKKAHPVEDSPYYLSTVKAKIRIPSVIQILYYVKRPYSRPKFSKKSVFMRDNYQCQYCGKHTNKPTLDHVIPRSKNGTNDWYNVVTACPDCNNKKGDRTLKEAGMTLVKQPSEPKYMIYSTILTPANIKRWEKYFYNKEKIPKALTALSSATV
ncbi:MAG: HNH endonuclease [Candidatus Goldbacteria bacterium]|nr:HNH endonuclease [Candidatus Goldiibacteriota bacterium]